MSAVPVYPVRVEGKLDPKLSRWLWLVKWLLAIPHFVVLAFLWIAFVVMTIVAFFAIVFTGRYPRSIFEFNLGVLRWTWRVFFYSYSALGTDRYPPFTLKAVPDYPATLDVPYPEHLSRGLALVKWWLLAIPHYLVVAFFVGGAGALLWAWPWGFGLIGVLVLIAAVALLFSGRYPGGIFDLVLGMNRWAVRVAAYAGLMTDEYPPFRLDLGGSDPAAITVGATEPAPPTTVEAGRWTGGKIFLTVVGSVLALVAAGVIAGGGLAVAVDQTQRDEDGYVMTPSERFSAPAYALVSESVDVAVDGPDELAATIVGSVRIRSESVRPVFVGIARESDVDAFVAGVRHAVVSDIGPDEEYVVHSGGAPPAGAAKQDFWVASSVGSGEQVLTWEPEDGSWNVVVMNADASPYVAADLSIGAELDNLLWIGVAIVAAGIVLLALAAWTIYAGVPKEVRR